MLTKAFWCLPVIPLYPAVVFMKSDYLHISIHFKIVYVNREEKKVDLIRTHVAFHNVQICLTLFLLIMLIENSKFKTNSDIRRKYEKSQNKKIVWVRL